MIKVPNPAMKRLRHIAHENPIIHTWLMNVVTHEIPIEEALTEICLELHAQNKHLINKLSKYPNYRILEAKP